MTQDMNQRIRAAAGRGQDPGIGRGGAEESRGQQDPKSALREASGELKNVTGGLGQLVEKLDGISARLEKLTGADKLDDEGDEEE